MRKLEMIWRDAVTTYFKVTGQNL